MADAMDAIRGKLIPRAGESCETTQNEYSALRQDDWIDRTTELIPPGRP
jgi:hypothetical protein